MVLSSTTGAQKGNGPTARDWESTFISWAQPPGETEQNKCDNAVSQVREAINHSQELSSRNIRVFPQGSYPNRTNVRQDSDVDICVCSTDTFFYDLSMTDGLTAEDLLIHPAQYTYPQFKNEVERALRAYFGNEGVQRGNKAFNIRENSYRVDADAVATFDYRLYTPNQQYHSGTKFLSDNGREIINWPQQNYDSGVAKNTVTSRRFKSIVRILKKLNNEMEDKEVLRSIPSYLVECLTWLVPNEGFAHNTLAADIRWVLAHLFNETKSDEGCGKWTEINQLKYLFHQTQQWTREEAHQFTHTAWSYIGFE